MNIHHPFELIIGGLYEHYKGNRYRLMNVAKHSETLELMVVYECLYDNPEGLIWVRPLSMFSEVVEVKGQKVPRFKLIRSS
ncbi:MAG: DUF1653 domain-containing protein [Bacteriovoracaceae bacterium]